jgi:hypothetical protein
MYNHLSTLKKLLVIFLVVTLFSAIVFILLTTWVYLIDIHTHFLYYPEFPWKSICTHTFIYFGLHMITATVILLLCGKKPE